MHLQVNQRLQEVASYKRDKFKPQEIDMALNKAMFRLLEKGIETKFQDTEVNFGHVSALIHKNNPQEVIIPPTGDPLAEDNFLLCYVVIPPDLYWLVNSRVEIVSDRVNCDTAPSLATLTLNEYVAVVPFPAIGSAPYFANTSMTSSVLGSMYTSPSQIAAGFQSSNSKYIVIGNITESLYRGNMADVYWERYRDVYYKDSFIVVSPNPIGTITLTSGGTSTIVASTQNSYVGYNRALIPAIPNKSVRTSSTKITQDQTLYDQTSNNQFYATSPVQPLSDPSQDFLTLYRDESFLITRSYIDYIRKPRTISLLLNQSCELADVTHPKIIDLAVELLRLDIKDPAYQATVQDTQLRTN